MPDLHIEVKSRKDICLGNAVWKDCLNQASSDAKGAPYVLLWKRDKHPWCATYKCKQSMRVVTVVHPHAIDLESAL